MKRGARVAANPVMTACDNPPRLRRMIRSPARSSAATASIVRGSVEPSSTTTSSTASASRLIDCDGLGQRGPVVVARDRDCDAGGRDVAGCPGAGDGHAYVAFSSR